MLLPDEFVVLAAGTQHPLLVTEWIPDEQTPLPACFTENLLLLKPDTFSSFGIEHVEV